MAHKRYKELDRNMTYVLAGTAILFVLYLLFAGLGIIWLKVVLSILIFLICGACLGLLHLSGELMKHRSRWMVLSAGCTALCLLVSLITNIP